MTEREWQLATVEQQKNMLWLDSASNRLFFKCTKLSCMNLSLIYEDIGWQSLEELHKNSFNNVLL